MQARGIKFDDPAPTIKSRRNEMMKEIHEFYTKDKLRTDKINCYRWLRRNKLKVTKENVERWKKTSGEMRKEISPATLASFWLSHIPTNDLPYIISIARDMERRKENFNKWLFWAIKAN